MGVTGIIGISSPEIARYAEFYSSLSRVARPPGTALAHSLGQVISTNRNMISERALEVGAEWVWYVDDDHLFQPDALMRLLARDVDIVSGLYLQRRIPYTPHRYNREEATGALWPMPLLPGDSGMSEALATGAGCLLVKTAVLRKMEPPYWRLGQMAPDVWGDDFDFCRRARAAGFKIWCDLDVWADHYVIHRVSPHRDEQGVWTTRIMEGQTQLADLPAAYEEKRS